MIKMSKRLEIRLDYDTFDILQNRAKESNQSLGEIVRQAIQRTYCVSKTSKLNAADKLCGMKAPVKDWEDMEKEIEKGRA